MKSPLLTEVFKFRHDDSSEFVTDFSLKWAERIVNRWSQSCAWARENVGDDEASRLAEYLGAMRDAASDRTRNFPFFEVEEEMEKAAKKNPEEWKDNPYGMMFISIVTAWGHEYSKIGKISKNDIENLFKLVVPDMERL